MWFLQQDIHAVGALLANVRCETCLRTRETRRLSCPSWREICFEPFLDRGFNQCVHFEALMAIEKKITGETYELFMSGRVDGAAANELEVEVLAVMRAGAKAIYVNLANATFLCSAALRVLLQYHRQMKSKGLVLKAARPSPEVASALEMTGFPELVEL